MQITLEAAEPHAIEAYSEHQIQINAVIYERSLIVSQQEIISDLAIKSIRDMDEAYLNLLLQSQPEVIIIGHRQLGTFPPISLVSQLSQKQVGIECMSVGAACRTYNVLLGEHRAVVAGFIF